MKKSIILLFLMTCNIVNCFDSTKRFVNCFNYKAKSFLKCCNCKNFSMMFYVTYLTYGCMLKQFDYSINFLNRAGAMSNSFAMSSFANYRFGKKQRILLGAFGAFRAFAHFLYIVKYRNADKKYFLMIQKN